MADQIDGGAPAPAPSPARGVGAGRTPGILAIIIVGSSMLMLAITFGSILATTVTDTNQAAVTQKFGMMKDLLLFINPFLGLVVGYYFSKASIEGRAESAELSAQQANASVAHVTNLAQQTSLTAQQATASAQQAAQAQQAAEQQALAAQGLVQEQSMVLEQVMQETAPPQPGTLGTLSTERSAAPGPGLSDATRRRVEALLQRSRGTR